MLRKFETRVGQAWKMFSFLRQMKNAKKKENLKEEFWGASLKNENHWPVLAIICK